MTAITPDAIKPNNLTPPTGQPRVPNPMMWWAPLLFLLAWNIVGYFYNPGAREESTVIPYSSFVDQVKADNVVKVEVKGSRIVGAFRHPTELSAEESTATNKAIAAVVEKDKKVAKPQKYQLFYTIIPETLGPSDLLNLLQQHKVAVVAFENTRPWFVKLFWNVLPFILLMLFFSWMGRRAASQQASIFGMGKATGKTFDPESSHVNFDQVAGADVAKQQLQETVDFLRQPQRFTALGARIPKGVLLAGPPGTGKTLLAKAVAGEAGVPFISVSGSEFTQMFVGLGASRVRELFERAREQAPAIIFIDELDAIGRRRGNTGINNDEREQTLNQLLVAMDGFDAHQDVVVLAATNRPDVLDPALLRPGRFDRQIVVGLPDVRGREAILKVHSLKLPVTSTLDFTALAELTIGMSGAQLANLCNEAALAAARQNKSQIDQQDFESALDKVILGDANPIILDNNTRRVIALHESGHALVAWLLAHADPVHKVTIIPHGQALGVTEQRPGADQYNYSKRYLEARLSVMLGGRVAEELAVGDITTGAENDLQQASHLARRMVTQWGMSEMGLAAWEENQSNEWLGTGITGGHQYSEQTAAKIDLQISNIMELHHRAVRELLEQSLDKLESLANLLLQQETVDYEQMVALLGEPARIQEITSRG